MVAAARGHTDIVIALVKAKANINAKDTVRVGLAGWLVVVCAEVEHPLGLSALDLMCVVAASAMPMPLLSPITTIQRGWDAISLAKDWNHHDTVPVLEQVVGE